MIMKLSTFFLLLASSNAQVSETIFDTLIPRACVNNELLKAGACTIQRGCAKTCFDRKTFDSKTKKPSSVEAASFSLETQNFSNFYIPDDAQTCGQFEEPICEATSCCPACKEELDELYRCIILEGQQDDDIHFLAETCPLDCNSDLRSAEQPPQAGVALATAEKGNLSVLEGIDAPGNRRLRGQRKKVRGSVPDKSGEPNNLERGLWGKDDRKGFLGEKESSPSKSSTATTNPKSDPDSHERNLWCCGKGGGFPKGEKESSPSKYSGATANPKSEPDGSDRRLY